MVLSNSNLQSHGDDYIFKRDDKSSIRLNYHHWVIKQICGYLLHPRIPKSSPDIRVADIGTGTGIWSIEMSSELPQTTKLDAFDLSPAQFPVQEFIPANLHFHVHDAFNPFPLEHQGKYDAVSIRFFLTVTNTGKVAPLIGNLKALLKPGGYLQWFEPDMLTTKAIAINPKTSKSGTESMVAIMKKPNPDAEYNWVPQLGSVFSEHGFEQVTYDRIPMVDKYRGLMSHVHLMTHEEYCSKLEESGMLEQAHAGRKAKEALWEEFHLGVSADTDHVCVVGRKPL